MGRERGKWENGDRGRVDWGGPLGGGDMVVGKGVMIEGVYTGSLEGSRPCDLSLSCDG